MIKFIKKIILFVVVFGLASGCILVYTFSVAAPQFENFYTGSIVDKIDRLESIDEPKIILVGNSNLTFGINSPMIEKEMEMPVVNLGLHGGLGNAFHLNMAKSNIQAGDIVVISLIDYDSYKISDPELLWITIENYDGYWRFVDKDDYASILKTLPRYVRKTIWLYMTNTGHKIPSDHYRRDYFNEQGDLIYPRYEQIKPVTPGTSNVPKIANELIEKLNSFIDYCEKFGAECVIAGFPLAYDGDVSVLKELEIFQEDLENAVECEVISNFKDYLTPYNLFFDGVPHLTDEGTIVRTKQLIVDLQNWKKNQP